MALKGLAGHVIGGTGHPTPLSDFPEIARLMERVSDLEGKLLILENMNRKSSVMPKAKSKAKGG